MTQRCTSRLLIVGTLLLCPSLEIFVVLTGLVVGERIEVEAERHIDEELESEKR